MSERKEEGASPKSRIELAIAAELPALNMSVSGEHIIQLTSQHLMAARHFSNELRRHEDEHRGEGWGSHISYTCWHGSAAIILAFASVEAAVNQAEAELFRQRKLAKRFDKAVPTLQRAREMVVLCNGSLPCGEEPYQSVEDLRLLRNDIIHFKPRTSEEFLRWRSEQLRRSKKRTALRPATDFDTEVMLGCMDTVITEWAIRSARAFIDRFWAEVGLPPLKETLLSDRDPPQGWTEPSPSD